MTRHRGALLGALVLVATIPGCRATARYGGVGPRRPPIRYTDFGDSARFPLTGGSAWSVAIPGAGPNKPYTTGLVLFSTRGAIVHLIRARPIARSHNLVVLGTGAAGRGRRVHAVLGSHGYPPVERPPDDQMRYHPLAQVPVVPDRKGFRWGVSLIMGVEYRTGHGGWLDGMEVTYRVGSQLYIAQFPMAFALCDHEPCVAPKTGAPWGPPP